MTKMERDNQPLDTNLNIKTRSDVLEYSLHIEDNINSLLLLYLGISDKSKTKLFGNKAGVSFKNKIDLLYDIDVLSKEEHASLELQMNFRNKFLHDIHSDSFLSILEQFDSGIRNRFKNYLDENGLLEEEESCRKGFLNLFLSNLKVISNKLYEKKTLIDEKYNLLQIPNNLIIKYIDFYFDLVYELLLLLESAEMENPKVAELAYIISSKCKEHANKLQTDIEIEKLQEKYSSQIFDDGKIKRFFK